MTDRNLLLEKNNDCQHPESASNLSSEAMALCQNLTHTRNSQHGDRSAELQQKDKANDFLPSLSIDKNNLNFCPANPSLKDSLKIAGKDILPPLIIINNEKEDSHIQTNAEIRAEKILSDGKFDHHEALKQAWAQMPRQHQGYESVIHTKDGQLQIGRYGLSIEQIENFLAVMDTPSASKTLDKLAKEHILTYTMEKNLENPQFRQEIKEFVKTLDAGESASHNEFKKFLPRQVQEAIASFHIEKMQETIGKNPGLVVTALDRGKTADSIEHSLKHEPTAIKTKADKLFHNNIENQKTIIVEAEKEKFKDLPNRIPEVERRPLIEKALRLAGVSPSESNIAALQVMVQEESSWDPKTTNGWDINAQRDTPSQGLIQTIPETFKRFAIKGYDQDITDPTSNLVAGIRYTISRYGALQRTPGITAMSHNAEYIGY
jgi:hypothetical protein